MGRGTRRGTGRETWRRSGGGPAAGTGVGNTGRSDIGRSGFDIVGSGGSIRGVVRRFRFNIVGSCIVGSISRSSVFNIAGSNFSAVCS